MRDVDAFVGGSGRLGALLRSLPPFEPPSQMEARFLSALPGRELPGADGLFEPPTSLEASVLAEAARLDAAQAPRRQATIDDLAYRGADAALGAPLSAEGQRWLESHMPRRAARGRPARRRWWFAPLGGALAASVALGVALQVLRDQPPLSEAPMMAPAATEMARETEALGAMPRADMPTENRVERKEIGSSNRMLREEAFARMQPKPSPQAMGKPELEAASTSRPAAPAAPARRIAPPVALASAPASPPLPAPEPAPAAKALAPPAIADAIAEQAATSIPSTAGAARQSAAASRAEPIEIKRFALQDENGIAEAMAATPSRIVRWQLSGATTDRAMLEQLARQLANHPLLSNRKPDIRVETRDTQSGWVQVSPIGG